MINVILVLIIYFFKLVCNPNLKKKKKNLVFPPTSSVITLLPLIFSLTPTNKNTCILCITLIYTSHLQRKDHREICI